MPGETQLPGHCISTDLFCLFLNPRGHNPPQRPSEQRVQNKEHYRKSPTAHHRPCAGAPTVTALNHKGTERSTQPIPNLKVQTNSWQADLRSRLHAYRRGPAHKWQQMNMLFYTKVGATRRDLPTYISRDQCCSPGPRATANRSSQHTDPSAWERRGDT